MRMDVRLRHSLLAAAGCAPLQAGSRRLRATAACCCDYRGTRASSYQLAASWWPMAV